MDPGPVVIETASVENAHPDGMTNFKCWRTFKFWRHAETDGLACGELRLHGWLNLLDQTPAESRCPISSPT